MSVGGQGKGKEIWKHKTDRREEGMIVFLLLRWDKKGGREELGNFAQVNERWAFEGKLKERRTDGHKEGTTSVSTARWTGEVGGKSSGECTQVNGRCV